MRIAYIYDAVYPWIKGGVERRIYEVGRRLAVRGHEVHWFGVGWWGKQGEKRDLDGIELHPVCNALKLYSGDRRSIIPPLKFSINLLKFGGDFDVVDCQVFPYFPALTQQFRFDRAERFLTWHEYWGDYWYEYLGKAGFFGKCIESAVCRMRANHIAVSELTRRELEIRGVKSAVVPNGIDFEFIRKVEPAEFETDVIFAGRLIKEKNLRVLIEALKNTDLTCLIVGNGPERTSLLELTKKYRIEDRVFFRDFTDYTTLISLMKASKVFVLPSRREGFGIVALEANACGLPVVTVRHKMNAAGYLVRDTGFMSSLSPADLAEKISMAIKKKKSIKKRCLENAKKYDWERIVERLEEIYEGKRYTAHEK